MNEKDEHFYLLRKIKGPTEARSALFWITFLDYPDNYLFVPT